MANVLVRVELYAATSVTEYEALHRAMEQIGFQRTIRDVGGATYRPADCELLQREICHCSSSPRCCLEGIGCCIPATRSNRFRRHYFMGRVRTGLAQVSAALWVLR